MKNPPVLKSLQKLILIAIMLFAGTTSKVQAADYDKAAHLGVSYAINTSLYGLFHKSMGAPTMPSLIFSSAITLFAGLVKEGMLDSKMDGGDMGANVVGVGLSTLTILTFDF